MKPVIHFLQVVTLATWLSVVAIGVIGFGLLRGQPDVQIQVGLPNLGVIEDVSLVEGSSSNGSGESTAKPSPEVSQPPAMPELVNMAALPEIPEVARPQKPVQTANNSTSQSSSNNLNQSKPPSRPNAGGSNEAAAARFAAGTMPAPRYPRESRRRGQEGTVVVEFTINASGKVSSVVAVKPSPWPLLNEEAVRTVRRWKFPAGAVMKKQLPIVFKLR